MPRSVALTIVLFFVIHALALMVWLLLGIVLLSCLLILVGPLLKPAADTAERSQDIAVYQAEIDRLDEEFQISQDPKVKDRKIDLQRQLIALTQNTPSKSPIPMTLVINGLFVTFIFGGLGLYSMLGRPDLTVPGALKSPTLAAPQALSQSAEPTHDNNMSLESLVIQLRSKLDGERKDDPDGWMLYARSLMNLGKFEEAFSAYGTVLTLTDSNPEVAAEFERAQAFAAQRRADTPQVPRGPSASDIEAASQMSETDRQAMIEGMVANLAARLSENPNDPEGWIKLLRARSVMGQTEQLAIDKDTVRNIFKDNPEIKDRILSSAPTEN